MSDHNEITPEQIILNLNTPNQRTARSSYHFLLFFFLIKPMIFGCICLSVCSMIESVLKETCQDGRPYLTRID